MSEPKGQEPRPYHHGDLRRALIEAARRLLETEGPAALSLRAVAREAGVSPAAPYHHFKDKSELLGAVSEEGWQMMAEAMSAARGPDGGENALAPVIEAYVAFARARPALYQVMFETARQRGHYPREGVHGHQIMREVLRQAAAGEASETGVELAVAAAWSASHGLAEMAGFGHFDPLKAELGGEAPFVAGVLRHMGFHGDGEQA